MGERISFIRLQLKKQQPINEFDCEFNSIIVNEFPTIESEKFPKPSPGSPKVSHEVQS